MTKGGMNEEDESCVKREKRCNGDGVKRWTNDLGLNCLSGC